MVSSELLPGPLLLRPDKLLRDDFPSKKRKKKTPPVSLHLINQVQQRWDLNPKQKQETFELGLIPLTRPLGLDLLLGLLQDIPNGVV